ncbi:hypothetical protein M011DRAFT_481791 [Sporormia fimetaria CBS 119925]|uniref:Uncharacterized protein n=1 Tax=Sporormia fimetaria CBS 119925 TaxID=1340428 RepID=A0A6A6UZA8_9PLEO|nr:hypothetical protein M011DRAFT_481791 [Sporormia fimetaria CBS 119925]
MKFLLLFPLLAQTALSAPGFRIDEGLNCHDYGPERRKYIKEKIALESAEYFCDQAARHHMPDTTSKGNFVRTYYQGTPEEIQMTVEWPANREPPKAERCEEKMKDISDRCNQDRDEWRSGGELKDGDERYEWHLNKERPRTHVAKMKPDGGCTLDYNFSKASDEYTIWGSGFLVHNDGYNIRTRLENRWLIVSDWDFKYTEGQSDREWTVTFRIAAGQWRQVTDVLKEVSDGQFPSKCV